MKELTKKDILEILKELIVTHDGNRLKLDYCDIHLGNTLSDLGYDSLDVAELCMAVESKLKIRIEDSEIETYWMKLTIEELVNFTWKKQFIIKATSAAQ